MHLLTTSTATTVSGKSNEIPGEKIKKSNLKY